MSGLILPDSVRIRTEFEANLERMKARHGFLRYFDQQLKSLDPRLELVKAAENSTVLGLKPGFWHIRRNNEGTVPTYYPIQTEDGGFKEPESGDLERLRAQDMQRPGAFAEFVKRQEAIAKQYDDILAESRDELMAEVADRVRFYENPSVSMMGGWTNSVKQRKARTA